MIIKSSLILLVCHHLLLMLSHWLIRFVSHSHHTHERIVLARHWIFMIISIHKLHCHRLTLLMVLGHHLLLLLNRHILKHLLSHHHGLTHCLGIWHKSSLRKICEINLCKLTCILIHLISMYHWHLSRKSWRHLLLHFHLSHLIFVRFNLPSILYRFDILLTLLPKECSLKIAASIISMSHLIGLILMHVHAHSCTLNTLLFLSHRHTIKLFIIHILLYC